MIEISDLKVTYGDFVALDIDREIHIGKNKKLGVLGSNGAGKSTLVNAILELIPYKGEIKKKIPKNDIAVHMQYNNYPDSIPVKTVIEAVIGCKIEQSEKILELIDFFGFGDVLKDTYKNLSGGQKQKLTVILVLAQEASLTIFDEVTSGLDFQTRANLMNLLGKWYKGREDSLILVSHYYDELERLVDDVLILEKGKVVDYGNKITLFRKYCGERVISFGEEGYDESSMASFKRIVGPEDRVVFSISNDEEEMELLQVLVAQNIDFERSSNDMEAMYMNAIKGGTEK